MFSFIEIVRLVIVTVSIGYIFSGFIKYPLRGYTQKDKLDNIKDSMMVAAPAVILHEIAHKITAVAYGINAEFFASYFGLGIGVFLKLISSPLIILAPGFVAISGATVNQSAIIAFMGPLTNIVLWGIAAYLLTTKMHFSKKMLIFLFYTKKINMVLFFFNMIPFGPFDGAKVFRGLLSLFS